MNDLRIEDSEQQAPYAGLNAEPAAPVVSADVAELRTIILWLSHQPWPQHESVDTWGKLIEAHRKDTDPDPLPELPSRAYRVGK